MAEVTEDGSKSHDSWLQLAKDAYTSSTDYLDETWRKTIERNIALFQSKHPTGSKYNSPAYKSKSRLFRPKIKSAIRKNEAAAAAAFFANQDVVNIAPENDADPAQVVSADIMNQLVDYRLTKTLNWFSLVIGAFQEAQVIGSVASYQYWDYKEGKVDKPCIELIPFENLRYHPSASWLDIVGTSPYLVRMVPKFVDDVRQMMQTPNPKTGQAQWIHYSDDEISTAMAQYDSTRIQRETRDRFAAEQIALKDFDVVWCHENFIRLGGEEVVYWTLGTQKMLTKPVFLDEAYWHGKRPIVIGHATIEAHKVLPDSLAGMGSDLQKEANEIANQRIDNVSLVLNKRYIVKRNAEVDINSLLRNVAGGVTMATDPDTDVREMNWPDVTSSSYHEQDLLNVDLDELLGNFSQSSVQTNRQLNETVGGMSMLRSSAGQMTDYVLKTFIQTWVEPVLEQLVMLEQAYETDTVLLTQCGQKSEMLQRYGVDPTLDGILNGSMTVRVSVGGATDPQARLGRFMGALKAYGEAMQVTPDADPEAIRKEVFGLLGYKSGDRFFRSGPDPAMQQMQQQMQDMQQMLSEMQQKVQEASLKLQDKSEENMIKAYDAETKRMQATKPDAPVQDNSRQAELEWINAERDRLIKIDLEHMKAQVEAMKIESAERQKLMELSSNVIEAQLGQVNAKIGTQTTTGEDGQVVEPEPLANTLELLMQAVTELSSKLEEKTNEKREILRDENGIATHVLKNGVPHRIIRDEQGKAVSIAQEPDHDPYA